MHSPVSWLACLPLQRARISWRCETSLSCAAAGGAGQEERGRQGGRRGAGAQGQPGLAQLVRSGRRPLHLDHMHSIVGLKIACSVWRMRKRGPCHIASCFADCQRPCRAWGGSSAPAKKERHEEEEDSDMRGELNPEEREALEGLVSEQADALKDGGHCPLCPCMQPAVMRPGV